MQVPSIIHVCLYMYRHAVCYRFSLIRLCWLWACQVYFTIVCTIICMIKGLKLRLKENLQSVYCWNAVDKLTTIVYMLCKLHTSIICMRIYRRRRHKKNTSFLHFNQSWPWTLNRFTENDPVALADVLEPSEDGKDQVDLHVEPTPGVYYMHIVYIYV